MSYLIILLVIGAVLGPLMAVLPSKRQRYLAELRDYAAERGLSVRLRTLPDVPPRLGFQPPHDLMCYEISVPGERSASLALGVFVRSADGWHSRDFGTRVPAQFDSLPEGAVLVSLGWKSLSVFWDERGGRDAVDRIIAVLEELRNVPE